MNLKYSTDISSVLTLAIHVMCLRFVMSSYVRANRNCVYSSLWEILNISGLTRIFFATVFDFHFIAVVLADFFDRKYKIGNSGESCSQVGYTGKCGDGTYCYVIDMIRDEQLSLKRRVSEECGLKSY
jgi:hypothetical protein